MSPHFQATARANKGVQGAGAGQQITISILNLAKVPNACALAGSGQSPANAVDVLLILGQSPNDIVVPGRYEMGRGFFGLYLTSDASCQTSSEVHMTAGTVDLTRADSSFEGTFDMSFPAGRMTGSFVAPLCGDGAGTGAAMDAAAVCVVYPPCDPSSGAGPCAQ
ncbi:MAG: hypothetical protein ACHQNA_08310 [Acidimicrobiales bacterium]